MIYNYHILENIRREVMFQVYRKLFAYVPEKRHLIFVSICLSALSTLAVVGAYYYLYLFFDRLLTEQDPSGSFFYAWVIFGLLIGGYAVYFIGVLASHVLGFRLETNLRKRGIDGLATASFRFFDLNSSGKIRKIIDDNASQTHTIVAHLLPDIANALVKPFLILILAFIVSIRTGIILTILTVAAVLLYTGMSGETQFMKGAPGEISCLSEAGGERQTGGSLYLLMEAARQRQDKKEGLNPQGSIPLF